MPNVDDTTAALRAATAELVRTDVSGLPTEDLVAAVARARLEVQRGQKLLRVEEIEYIRQVMFLAREEIALRTKRESSRLNPGPRA